MLCFLNIHNLIIFAIILTVACDDCVDKHRKFVRTGGNDFLKCYQLFAQSTIMSTPIGD